MENSSATIHQQEGMLSYEDFRNEVLKDYRVMLESRETSLLGRREVLTGKAKFGIFGDGKEMAQVAMAKFFRPGDWRSGYYRDQTFIFASGIATVQQFFAQLYADPDSNHEPFSSGRQMSSHFTSPNFDTRGKTLPLIQQKNVATDMAPTAAQMPRSLGLALASKLFRNSPVLKDQTDLSDNGNEVCFCTIGDASTSEGHFWETVNAAGVLQVPLAIFIWDDGYGISVPKKYQTTKGSISAALKGFQKRNDTNGIDIYTVKGWDYAGMCEVFEAGLDKIRQTHIPAVFHVEEITQPQGHSTSGSHERYKDAERLQWERDWDCIKKMKEWILENNIATEDELEVIEEGAKEIVKQSRSRAWEEYVNPIKEEVSKAVDVIRSTIVNDIERYNELQKIAKGLEMNRDVLRRDIMHALSLAIHAAGKAAFADDLINYYNEQKKYYKSVYNSYLYNQGASSAMRVEATEPVFANDAPAINGYEIINRYFDQLFAHNKQVVAFGEDVGFIGDVNQGFAGLQEKHGEYRVFDTGIRELTIMGQGIGLALRGLRPIAEIQYLDYLVYGLQPLTDDVATLQYRTKGVQHCPLIVRSRGHRLEGIWHSGSPMGMIINSLRGMHVCVPRNMVQAAAMYNTILKSNDPAIIIECLNGYRLKEKLPSNLLEITVALGVPEILKEGDDITIVSYGSTLRIIQDAANRLEQHQISCEIIDVQTLLPFDIHHSILESLKKTNRIVFVDEDVPGGAAAYMFNKVMEEQGGYRWLDVAPRTITAKPHRPAYGSDGDYFSKPNAEDIFETIMEMMNE
ncbi:transketolase [Panacibacter ginsenosidivorans]|uniref:3-methyl-2-oxobutanoate dehydrogenase (2-methylpropanoyl-transferring) n=1 Tax=Panacibacter ginsenosidivorans TaxID=1813871 RepID=A0A5B8VDH1_9BACT|nr:alpha-ketoacid dehydrogenase subunit alpha/beta [Panacibacter ginsenosidivorans]QEC69043.1 transketolase [Panacibacter ginsenosidivorans]